MTRTGIPTILKVAKVLCKLLDTFGAIIVALSGEDPTVINVLETAKDACEALEVVLKTLLETGD